MSADFRRVLRAAVGIGLQSGLVLAAGVRPAAAQQEAVVEQLAPVLAAEDARDLSSGPLSERPGGARLAGPPARRDGRRQDRRSPGHPAAGPAALRPRFHRAGRGGVRDGPPARHRRRAAADGSDHRPSGARRPDRAGGHHRARQDRRSQGRQLFRGHPRWQCRAQPGRPPSASRPDRARVLAPRAGCARGAAPPVPGGHRGRIPLEGGLHARSHTRPRGSQPAHGRRARPGSHRARHGGSRSHPRVRGFGRPRAQHRRGPARPRSFRSQRAGADQCLALAGKLSGLLARDPRSSPCSTIPRRMCRSRRP